MSQAQGCATTLERKLIPFLISIEKFLAGAGLAAADYSSYTEIRRWFEAAVPIIRSGGPLWAPTAEAAFLKLNELHEGLPIIFRTMPPKFTQEWNEVAGLLAEDNARLQDPS